MYWLIKALHTTVHDASSNERIIPGKYTFSKYRVYLFFFYIVNDLTYPLPQPRWHRSH